MNELYPTTMSLNERDQLMREKLEIFGYTVIGTWRYGAAKLLQEMKSYTNKKTAKNE